MFVGDELHRYGIDAVASILAGHPFTEENMSQMPAAIVTNNLGAKAVGVGVVIDGAGDLVIKAGPTAMAVELVRRAVKRRVTPSAKIGAGLFPISQFAGERPLCAFTNDDVSFLARQFVVFGRWLIGIHVRNSLSAASGCKILRNQRFSSDRYYTRFGIKMLRFLILTLNMIIQVAAAYKENDIIDLELVKKQLPQFSSRAATSN